MKNAVIVFLIPRVLETEKLEIGKKLYSTNHKILLGPLTEQPITRTGLSGHNPLVQHLTFWVLRVTPGKQSISILTIVINLYQN